LGPSCSSNCTEKKWSVKYFKNIFNIEMSLTFGKTKGGSLLVCPTKYLVTFYSFPKSIVKIILEKFGSIFKF